MRRAPKPLRSLAVLTERSAIPSRSSVPASTSHKVKLSSTERARLRRIARRAVETEVMTSADVRAVSSSLHDAWVDAPIPTGAYGEEGMVKRAIKPPPTLAKHRGNYLRSQEAGRAIDIPDGGVSYNPTEESHRRLLSLALEEEEARLKKEAEDEERTKALSEVKNARSISLGEEYVNGMRIGPGEGLEVDATEEPRVVKPTRRKTQAERNKALRLRQASQLEADETRRKKMVKSIASVPALRSSIEKREKRLTEAGRVSSLAKKERERLGLEGGEKIGKHRVGKGGVAVQLGEDLAETLRQVKVSTH